MRYEEGLLSQLESYRRTLFIGVTLSTSAVISSVIFIPFLFFHLQSLQTSLSHELHFCTVRSHDLWDELREVERSEGVKSRIKRQNFLPTDPNPITYPYLRRSGSSYHSTTIRPPTTTYPSRYQSQNVDGIPDTSIFTESSTRRNLVTVRPIIEERTYQPRSSVCIFGPPGPRGYDGADGLIGQDGFPGRQGVPAPDYVDRLPAMADITFCQQCATAEQGRPGYPGQKGLPGMTGMPGMSFLSSRNPPGPVGAQGMQGLPGLTGLPGASGAPGALFGEEIQYGPPGPPGPQGPIGAPGSPGIFGRARYGARGEPGSPGAPGTPGGAGTKGGIGMRGSTGNRGACEHCPPPQLAPGYR